MKVTKSQLKELIKHTIIDLKEKVFGSKAKYDAYRKNVRTKRTLNNSYKDSSEKDFSNNNIPKNEYFSNIIYS